MLPTSKLDLLDNPEPQTSNTVRYPHVHVQLTGTNGSAFSVLGRCQTAAKRANVPPDEITAFLDEASDGDYDHLLQTCMNWFDVS